MTGPLLPGPSAHVALRPVDGAAITGGMWHRRRLTNAEISVPDGYASLAKAGNLHNLRLAAGTATGEYASDLRFMEIETALVELYRTTGEPRYLALAKHFIDQRGHGLLRAGQFGDRHWQDHVPVRDATEVAGHVVRQLYLLAGVVDVHAETGEAALLAAAERLWADMVDGRTYLTGGLGAHHTGEAFGDRYELPSERAYAETCAAVASIQLSWRLLLATGRARYADLMERTLYNGFAVGVALSGDRYRYVNPLQVREGHIEDHGSIGRPWFHCACCPPNVLRLLASLQHYVAARDNTGIVLHQFVPGEYWATTQTGPVTIRVDTEYPWRGDVDVHIGQSGPLPWTVTLRVPDWCASHRITANGQRLPDRPIDGWLRIERNWAVGDVLRLELAMPPRLTSADPRVDAVRGCVAIERGSLVYCVEHADHSSVSLDDVVLDPGAPLDVIERPDLLGGVVTVTATGRLRSRQGTSWWPYRHDDPSVADTVRLTAIPYQVWGHREPGAMRVWLPNS